MSQKNEDIIFGIHACVEALRSGKEVNKVMIQRGLRGDLVNKLIAELKASGIEPVYVPDEKLNKFGNRNHQGVIALISPVAYQEIEDVLPLIFESGKVPLILLLDRITDVRNFGAISRSAECMGVDAIIIPEKGGASITSDAIKTSAGALMKIPVCRHLNLKSVVDYLKESGLQIIGCTEKTDQFLYDVDMTLPSCIIMGNEEEGISPEYLKRCTHKAKIPMSGTIESLNVSVSAGIIVYEALRQRGK
ncbi:MAG TPA: 23S rRNA (guanosine(2251)-2'-O)-methyltransferase RlmB [Flavobacteriales bacterium]|nr:23S rRNA (guanosine(2251)-2'-O)-methyltransferase RlmB [Flavobacteriales bacterium]